VCLRPRATPRWPKKAWGRGDAAVTGEREIGASAHAVAFDGGDDGGGMAGDRVHQSLNCGGEIVSFGAG
jgi:hypothetical protein